MATPSNRVPVRIARGLKAVLEASILDLREGEIVYAKDEDTLYVVENGALVAAGSSGGIGRGDGGNFETMTIETPFVTNILGGGDFENSLIDQPVENFGLRDGGLFT